MMSVSPAGKTGLALASLGLLAALLILPGASAGGTMTFTVDHPGDDTGQACLEAVAMDCSLRSAIENAEANGGLDTIEFNYTAFGTYHIKPATALPSLSDTTFILAQPGAGPSGAPLVTVDGLDAVAIGFDITGSPAGGSVIEGLSIVNFTTAGIDVAAGLTGAVIRDSYIGLLPNGTIAGNGIGIRTAENNTIIGGTGDAGDGNVISGNIGDGIQLGCGGGGTFHNNLIGTLPDGTTGAGNGGWGINDDCTEFGKLQIGGAGTARNVISDNSAGGIFLGSEELSSEPDPRIENNYIGVGSNGATVLGNGGPGVMLDPAGGSLVDGNLIAHNVDIGIEADGTGDGTFSNNIVRDNVFHGIQVDSGTDATIADNTVHDNGGDGIHLRFGASHDVTDNDVRRNGFDGIHLHYADSNTLMGNTVGSNTNGIYLLSSLFNLMFSNYVGATSGGADIGNDCDGIVLDEDDGGSSDNTIGGIASGDGNVVAFNKGCPMESEGPGPQTGIIVYGGSTGNVIRGNSIHSNVGLGIDLVGGTEDEFFVTANDPGDGDPGPNGLTNYPVISSASGGSASGTLSALPSTRYVIDVYGSNSKDESGFGEGRYYAGSVSIMTDGSGSASWSISATLKGNWATATATRQVISGTGQMGEFLYADEETSEFSKAVAIQRGDLISGCFDPDPHATCPLTSSTTSTTTTSTTSTTSTSTTTTTTTSTTSTATSTSTTTSDAFLDVVDQVVLTKNGERVSPLLGVDGIVEARFQSSSSDISPDRVCVELVDQNGNQVQVTPPGGGTFDLNRLDSGYYTARAFVCASAASESMGFRPLGTGLVLAEQTVLVMHPMAELTPTIQSVAAGVAIIGTAGLVLQTMWARTMLFMGEAAKETAIAIGEDRLRGKTAQGMAHGTTAGLSRKVRAWGSFLFAVVLLGIFFALEGASSFTLEAVASVLPIIGVCALYFFAAQFGFEYLASRASGVTARFRFLLSGAISLALSTLLFRVAFGYPGYIDEDDPEGQPPHMLGVRSLGVFGIMLGICIPFVVLGRYISFAFFEEGIGVAVVAVATATLPFAPLPGADVWKWRPFVSLLTMAGAMFLFFGYQLAMIDPFVWALLGVVGILVYTAVTGWLLLRQQDPLPSWFSAMASGYNGFRATLARMRPAWMTRFKAARIRFYKRLNDRFDRAMTAAGMAIANAWRRLRGRPPVVLQR